jgi:hypothetical protein
MISVPAFAASMVVASGLLPKFSWSAKFEPDVDALSRVSARQSVFNRDVDLFASRKRVKSGI